MRRTAPLLLLVLLALVATACSSLPNAEEAGGEGVYTVTLEQASQRLDSVDGLVVLDVRTPEEFAAGHLPGAVNVNFYADDFEDRVAELDPDASYLVYCSQGGRSGSAGGIMQELDFTDVADMTDGFPAWADAGYEIAGA